MESFKKNLIFVFFRGLFEKDKTVFSFMLCVEIMKQEGKITPAEWNFFLRGAAGMDKTRPTKPDVPFLNNVKVWNNAFDLNETIPIFKGIHNDLTKTPCWVKLGNDEVMLVGCIEDLRRFSGISAISLLGSRR